MKKLLLLSLLLSTAPVAGNAADLAIEPVAPVVTNAADMSGYLEVYGIQVNFVDDIWSGFGVTGALAYRLDANWQIQAEIGYQSAGAREHSQFSLYSGLAALHVNYYADSFAIGAFGGLSSMAEWGNDGTVYSTFGGLEAQLAITENIVVDGQVGLLHTFDAYYHDDYPMDVGFAQIGVKFFPLDNVKLQATASIAKGEVWTDGDIDIVTLAVEGEYQFEGTPVSLFANYSFMTDNFYGEDASTVKVGARFSFDGASLKDQAVSGASNRVYDLGQIENIRWY